MRISIYFLVLFVFFSSCKQKKQEYVNISDYKYIGRESCTECHQEQHDLFVGSHHDKAMEPATDKTVLGDFNNVTFTHYGVESKFYKKGDDFYVYTEGLKGEMNEFKVEYTFGFYPLTTIPYPIPEWQLPMLTTLLGQPHKS